MSVYNFHAECGIKKLLFGGNRRLALLGVAFVLLFAVATEAGPEKLYRNPLGMEFVYIEAGVFTMGSPPGEARRAASETAHPVQISEPFYLMTTEVTLEQWWAVMGKRWIGRRKGTPDMPVIRVSWYDCIRFVNRLNETYPGAYRLPTEAQWEYASRAGSTTAFAWGDAVFCEKAMFGNNPSKSPECVKLNQARGFSPKRPAPVKSYPPNAWGLFDMHGNVWEWCQDWYGEYPQGVVRDPQGPDSGVGKIRRGGSFFGPAELCRSANRAYSHPAGRLDTTGFRLVWNPKGEKTRQPDEPPPAWHEELDGP